MGKEFKKERIYVQLIHFAIHLKLTQHCNQLYYKNFENRDFPGGPADKTSSSNAGGVGLIPQASRPKNENIKQKQCFINSIKILRNGPHLKNLKDKFKN